MAGELILLDLDEAAGVAHLRLNRTETTTSGTSDPLERLRAVIDWATR